MLFRVKEIHKTSLKTKKKKTENKSHSNLRLDANVPSKD